ncbi:MAG: pyridoxal phosphate-dependent aminotransferase [Flavobacteriaceae bacterium]|nr:pyridoxal phosphate-dependent aminotransferase [Flavobacteriaceae bacterium]MCY4267737.1 pyridoxal phosphate-dependent aminotransferase [Flavobacteriaceae bacterium]MCY4298454.1 pyridoxal phosphate-dependent aminotransferase [Flavobacteriaceae bacterium]
MNALSQKVINLPESATLAMANKAREIKRKGVDIINLSIGEPDFNTPEFIKKAAIDAINQDYNGYTPVDGYLELREAICHKLRRDNQLTYQPNQIVVSTGAKQCIANILMALLNPQDQVLLPCPFWVSYTAMTVLNQSNFSLIPSSIDSRYKITAQQLKSSITPKTKVVIFNSPNNPSGSVYSKEEFIEIGQVLMEHPHVYIISDEIYEHINYGVPHYSLANIPELSNRTIVVNGLSKSFAMTGWRLGYMAGPEWIAAACKKIQGQFTSGTNCIAQRAAITALMHSPTEIHYMVDAFKKRRDYALELLKTIPDFKINKPDGAFYLFPDVSSFYGSKIKGIQINHSTDLALFLLEHAQVATVAGSAFGQKKSLRLSYATSEEQLDKAIGNIARLLNA